MKPEKTWPKQYKINNERNSDCSVRLKNLDWNNWFTDGMWIRPPAIYLHVNHKDIKGMGDTIHRVSCKKSCFGQGVRITMKDGELYWLVDKIDKRRIPTYKK